MLSDLYERIILWYETRRAHRKYRKLNGGQDD